MKHGKVTGNLLYKVSSWLAFLGIQICLVCSLMFMLSLISQAVANINSLLERADRVYRQLVSHRQPLDLLLNRLLEHGQQEPLQVKVIAIWALLLVFIGLFSLNQTSRP